MALDYKKLPQRKQALIKAMYPDHYQRKINTYTKALAREGWIQWSGAKYALTDAGRAAYKAAQHPDEQSAAPHATRVPSRFWTPDAAPPAPGAAKTSEPNTPLKVGDKRRYNRSGSRHNGQICEVTQAHGLGREVQVLFDDGEYGYILPIYLEAPTMPRDSNTPHMTNADLQDLARRMGTAGEPDYQRMWFHEAKLASERMVELQVAERERDEWRQNWIDTAKRELNLQDDLRIAREELDAAREALEFTMHELAQIPAPITDTRFATECINSAYATLEDALAAASDETTGDSERGN